MDDDRNCQWRVARRPDGNVVADDFEYTETAIPDPGDGEFLVRTMYLNLAPVMRMYMSGESAAGEAPLAIGDVIHGRSVAEVVDVQPTRITPWATSCKGNSAGKRMQSPPAMLDRKYARCRTWVCRTRWRSARSG